MSLGGRSCPTGQQNATGCPWALSQHPTPQAGFRHRRALLDGKLFGGDGSHGHDRSHIAVYRRRPFLARMARGQMLEAVALGSVSMMPPPLPARSTRMPTPLPPPLPACTSACASRRRALEEPRQQHHASSPRSATSAPPPAPKAITRVWLLSPGGGLELGPMVGADMAVTVSPRATPSCRDGRRM